MNGHAFDARVDESFFKHQVWVSTKILESQQEAGNTHRLRTKTLQCMLNRRGLWLMLTRRVECVEHSRAYAEAERLRNAGDQLRQMDNATAHLTAEPMPAQVSRVIPRPQHCLWPKLSVAARFWCEIAFTLPHARFSSTDPIWLHITTMDR